jgi:hypothetical protein
MDILFYLTVVGIAFLLGWLAKPAKPAVWETVEVNPAGKGPNVDKYHYRILTDEGLFDFTDHEKARAKVRAPGTMDYHAEL